MSERKVLNKYYPPDFDPSKIPRMKLAKNRQYTVRLMAPFNMRCVTCGEYIYKGKKFNARKEDVEGEDYLGIRIFRFYIKCTRCLQEISFRTDPKNTDYEIEAGATRNFMALKLAEEQAQREEDERIADEATNPMKLLENRTEQSKQELDLIESLEELKDLNKRQRSVNYDEILLQYQVKSEAEQEQEDEELIKSIFKKAPANGKVVEEIIEVAGEDDSKKKRSCKTVETVVPEKVLKSNPITSSHENQETTTNTANTQNWNKSVGTFSRKNLSSLVRTKTAPTAGKPSTVTGAQNILRTKTVPIAEKPITGALSMLGSYSSSEEE